MRKKVKLQLKNKQRQFAEKVLYGEERTLIMCTGRQVGKTHTMIAIMGLLLYNSKVNLRIGFISLTTNHNKDIIRRFSEMFRLKEKMTDVNKQDGIITYSNSMIKFLSAEQRERIRGNTFDYLFIDEACFMNSDLYTEAITPLINASLSQPFTNPFEPFKGKIGGKLILASTPKTRNWFYDLVVESSSNPSMYLMRFRSIDSEGLLSQEVLETLKRRVPERIFNCEYNAEFLDAGNGLFQYKTALIDEDEFYKINTNKDYYIGIDWGTQNDYTVVTIINKDKVIQEIIRVNEKTNSELQEIIEQTVNKYKKIGTIQKIISEQNGIGIFPTKELLTKYPNITQSFSTNNKNKSEIIESLSTAFEQGQIKFNPNDKSIEILKLELDGYVQSIDDKNVVRYTASSGHDDMVMSLAFAHYGVKNRQTSTTMIINSPDKKRF